MSGDNGILIPVIGKWTGEDGIFTGEDGITMAAAVGILIGDDGVDLPDTFPLEGEGGIDG